MKYPLFLSSGDTIGFTAPSFGCTIEPYSSCFEAALSNFEQLGFKTLCGLNCYKDDGVGISTNPFDCARELTSMYTSNDSQVLLSCGGGELMCETIGNVDFEKIKASTPHWFMGYSDNTNFGFLLTTLCDVASIYGPNAPSFGMTPWHEAITDALNLLCGKQNSFVSYEKWEKESLKSDINPFAPYNCTEPSEKKIYTPSLNKVLSLKEFSELGFKLDITGRFTGGCLDCLQTLCGTKYDKVKEYSDKYKSDGLIWFLESCDLNVFSMRRAMWQLDQAGWFNGICALIIGRPMHFHEDMFGLNQYEAILPIARKYNIPVIFDMDLGHLPPAIPMVNGSTGRLFTIEEKINITYNYE